MPGLNVISFHVSPPSVVFHSPLRPPPAFMPHGMRWNFHIAAKRMRGFVGSIVRSIAPVESLRKSTFFHELPPSVVRKTPRSGVRPERVPDRGDVDAVGIARVDDDVADLLRVGRGRGAATSRRRRWSDRRRCRM